ncbi:TOBE domain-containing protein, partial [Mesorhizobium sp. M00.F.Ca.ET.149.01.1.1]
VGTRQKRLAKFGPPRRRAEEVAHRSEQKVRLPPTLYDRPATRFVASFIGTMNLLQSRFVGRDGERLRFAAGELPLEATSDSGEMPAAGDTRTIGVRPEDLLAASEAAEGTVPARVSGVVFHGRTLRLHAELEQGTSIVIDAPRRADGSQFSVGDVAHVSLRRGANCPVLSN